MKLRIGLAMIVACVLGGALVRYHGASRFPADERAGRARAAAHPASDVPAARQDGDRRDSPATFIPITGGKPRVMNSMDPFFRVPKTRYGLPLENDYFVAESMQEQRWLDRNGYPNSQQMAAYSAASDMVLEQAAAHGDSVAEVMLASRQLTHGDPQAAGKLMTAGKNGSSYALSLLAAYLVGAKNGNPELGYAVSRVVEMRGDWRSAIARDFMFRTPLTPLQKARAEVRAIQMLEDFREHSPVHPYVDPRPWRPRNGGNRGGTADDTQQAATEWQ